MIRESKSIFLVGLVLTVYAFMILSQSGGFVYPYPLNPAIFLAISLQFAVWNKKEKLTMLLPVISGLFGVLASPFLWESCLSLEYLEEFYKAPFIEWFKLFFAISMLTWGIYTASKQKQKGMAALTLLGILSFVLLYLMSYNQLLIISYGIITLSTIISPVNKGLDKLWILLFLLEITFGITILCNL